MNSLNLIPKGSRVLLTAPVIIYGMFAKKPTKSVPLSEQCNHLLDSCRVSYYQGVVTTGIVARCWQIAERIRDGTPNLEEDAEFGSLAHKIHRAETNSLPKRINGLLLGDLEVAKVEVPDFGLASELVKNHKIPVMLALDIAAASRHCAGFVSVALASMPAWQGFDLCRPYCANDLPWQKASHPTQVKKSEEDFQLGAID